MDQLVHLEITAFGADIDRSGFCKTVSSDLVRRTKAHPGRGNHTRPNVTSDAHATVLVFGVIDVLGTWAQNTLLTQRPRQKGGSCSTARTGNIR